MIFICGSELGEIGRICKSTWVGGVVERLEKWHHQIIGARWRYRPTKTRLFVLAIIAFATLVILMNMQVRNAQYEAWATHHGTSDEFAFSTIDASYFLGLAAALKRRGETVLEYESLLAYPDNMLMVKETPENITDKSPTLLSIVSSHIASSNDPADLIEAGHRLIVICYGLTVAFINLAFAAAGYWLEGKVAAAGAGLSAAYLVRRSAGRIDTGMLNMGLLFATFGVVLLAGRTRSTRSLLPCCVAAGFMAKLFLTWYDRSQLI